MESCIKLQPNSMLVLLNPSIMTLYIVFYRVLQSIKKIIINSIAVTAPRLRALLLNCRRLVLCYIEKSCLQIFWMDSWVYLWKGLHESRSSWSIGCCWSWHWLCNGMWHVLLEFIKTIKETGICLYRYDIYRSFCTLFAFLYAPQCLVVMVCFSKIMLRSTCEHDWRKIGFRNTHPTSRHSTGHVCQI